ncbi:NADH-quinone oxidoreductase subunit C [Actinomadura welshii]|uniref:hydrogenase large subunit n=1 Tax=Actinomadura welshii TaxID=3103817 RepID=UPI000463DA7A|nr:NADH-quinone oxidoreductase subunit C [Actinomadura madurae]
MIDDLLGSARPAGWKRLSADTATADLPGRFAALRDAGYGLASAAAHHDPDGTLRVVYLLVEAGSDARVELVVRPDGDPPAVPSLAALSFPAGRFEREMHDLFGITPAGHPLPRRLVRHPHWPRGWYPMRADAADPPPPFGDPEPYPFLTVEGPGVYEIPVGPIHAGVIEPGHFRFSVVGETILKLKARLWFTHKGTERLFQGAHPADKLALAERISGDTAVGHALAYCLAVEDATGCLVPPEAQRIRAVLLELERLHNHVADLGALCNDVGHSVLHAHALRLREMLLRLNEELTGHRLLRGGIVLGGAALRALPAPGRLRDIGGEVRDLAGLALSRTIVRDRFTGTAVLDRREAAGLGTLGYVARASGIDADARRDHPFTDAYADLGGTLAVHTETGGDVMARFLVRAREIETSIDVIAALVDGLAPGWYPGAATGWPPRRPLTGPASGAGIVEGWRGRIVHRVEVTADHRLTRVKVVDPSFFNWPALPVALRDTIVPDFPLANKSFNLSYAGNDL